MQNAMLQSLTGCTDTALVSVEPTFSVTDKGTVQVDLYRAPHRACLHGHPRHRGSCPST